MDKKKEPKKGNGYGNAGLILGVASIFLGWIWVTPLLAIIFSSIGISKNKVLGGKTASIIGLILGIIYLIIFIFQEDIKNYS